MSRRDSTRWRWCVANFYWLFVYLFSPTSSLPPFPPSPTSSLSFPVSLTSLPSPRLSSLSFSSSPLALYTSSFFQMLPLSLSSLSHISLVPLSLPLISCPLTSCSLPPSHLLPSHLLLSSSLSSLTPSMTVSYSSLDPPYCSWGSSII